MDTANKRASAIMVSLPFRGILPLPDASVDAWDRPTVAFMYDGIGSTEGATTDTGSSLRRLLRYYSKP